MKIKSVIVGLSAFILSNVAFALEAPESAQLDKVRTALLPGGGTYSVYQVQCSNQFVSNIVEMKRGGQWCALEDGSAVCVRKSREAARLACISTDVAEITNATGESQI
ncbi:MAG: hypothetical protein V7746_05120 [Halioglobus sp.]